MDSMPRWQKNLPTYLTFSRMVMALPIAVFMNHPSLGTRLACAILFILASATDYLDGYFARKWNAMTNWGKFMDPIADKVLVTAILVMFIPPDKIEPWMVIILVCRDLLIGGLRSIAAADQMVIAAGTGGKWKTALQMVAIPSVMIGDSLWDIPFTKIGNGMLWAATVLSLTSAVQYFYAYEKARLVRGKPSSP